MLGALRQVLHEDAELATYQDECRAYTLQRLPDGGTKAYRNTFEQFDFMLGAELEIRGETL